MSQDTTLQESRLRVEAAHFAGDMAGMRAESVKLLEAAATGTLITPPAIITVPELLLPEWPVDRAAQLLAQWRQP